MILIMIFWLGWMFFVSSRRPSFKNVLNCQICSKTICKMCQHHFLDLTTCADCWKELKAKRTKPSMAEGWRGVSKRLHLPLWMITLFIPGSGHILLRKSVKGAGWTLLFSFISSIFILNRNSLFIVADSISGSGLNITGGLFPWLFLYSILYLFMLFDLRRELEP